MWIGAYEQEGRTSFFAITSEKSALGPFTTFKEAQFALNAFEKHLDINRAKIADSLVPIEVRRATRLAKNTFGNWLFGEPVAGTLVFFYEDELLGKTYLVFYETGFAYLGAFLNLSDAVGAASAAAKAMRVKKPGG